MRYWRIIGFYEKAHREDFFYRCFRFLESNQIEGDYLEFGCCGGTTFRLASKYIQLTGFRRRSYAFDSFKGLPTPKGIDVHPQWKASDYCESIEEFTKELRSAGIKESEYTLVPGFYAESLTESTRQKLNIKAAALVYIDCDLYESTTSVLKFIPPLLKTGTVIAFDDFYAYNGDPARGQQLAMREFLQQNPDFELGEYLNIGWHGKSFIVKRHQ